MAKKTPEKMMEDVMAKQFNTHNAHRKPIPREVALANCRSTLTLAYLPKIDRNDPMAVRERVKQYFEIIAENGSKPTVPSLALAFGIDRRTLLGWVNGAVQITPESQAELKMAYTIINAEMEGYMMESAINPVSGIFLLKNHFGYTDKTELEVSTTDPLGVGKSREEINERYMDTVVDVDYEEVE